MKKTSTRIVYPNPRVGSCIEMYMHELSEYEQRKFRKGYRDGLYKRKADPTLTKRDDEQYALGYAMGHIGAYKAGYEDGLVGARKRKWKDPAKAIDYADGYEDAARKIATR